MPGPKAFSHYANRFFYPVFQQLNLLFPAIFLLKPTRTKTAATVSYNRRIGSRLLKFQQTWVGKTTKIGWVDDSRCFPAQIVLFLWCMAFWQLFYRQNLLPFT